MGEGVGVSVGWGSAVGVCVAVGMVCPGEQDKKKSVKVITNKICDLAKRVLIRLLLADGILDLSQSFDFDSDFVAVL